MINLIDIRVVDARIYCKVEKDPISIIHGVTHDLKNDAYFLMLASGPNVLETTILNHGPIFRGTSAEAMHLIPRIPDEPNIFDGCGETKVCFGIPNLCFRTGNCDQFVGVTFNKETDVFTFEMRSMGDL